VDTGARSAGIRRITGKSKAELAGVSLLLRWRSIPTALHPLLHALLTLLLILSEFLLLTVV
jgi:hypothetical protein